MFKNASDCQLGQKDSSFNTHGRKAMTANEKKRITDMRYRKASYADIASALDVPISTVKTFCHRNGLSDSDLANQAFCRNCGSAIRKGKYRPRLFCSDQCRMNWWNSHPESVNRTANYSFVCAACGQAFTAYGNAKRKYCSRACYLASRHAGEVLG